MTQTMMQETPDIETSSEDYARRFAGRVGAWFLRRQQQAVCRMIARWPGACVADVGGGHGQLTEGLLAQGCAVTVVGSDASCSARLAAWLAGGKRCRFEQGNLLALPFADAAFDVAVSVRLLPHLSRWDQAVAELGRIARHAVVVDFPVIRSLNCLTPALFSVKKQIEGNTRPYRLFDEREITAAFARAGFVPAARAPQFVLPMVLHRMLKLPALSQALEGFCALLGLRRWLGSPVIALFVRHGAAGDGR